MECAISMKFPLLCHIFVVYGMEGILFSIVIYEDFDYLSF